VQNLNPLRPFILSSNESTTNDPGTVKITIRKFYRVSGASTQSKGVEPDIVLPDTLSYLTSVGEDSLENALPWDTIPSANYDKFNLVQPYLAPLRLRSEARLATNRDFIYIRQDIDEFRKSQVDKTASLNENDDIKQMEQIQVRHEAREKERATRGAPDKKIHEITVENADQPGLPPQSTNIVNNANISETQHAETARLDETEHIFEDYIPLLETNHILIANHE
jgi:carboxyl-terminal processing protease